MRYSLSDKRGFTAGSVACVYEGKTSADIDFKVLLVLELDLLLVSDIRLQLLASSKKVFDDVRGSVTLPEAGVEEGVGRIGVCIVEGVFEECDGLLLRRFTWLLEPLGLVSLGLVCISTLSDEAAVAVVDCEEETMRMIGLPGDTERDKTGGASDEAEDCIALVEEAGFVSSVASENLLPGRGT